MFSRVTALETQHAGSSDRISAFQEDTLVQGAFTKGTDLREYAKFVSQELSEVEQVHILDYVKQSQNLVDLHQQIQSCDDILNKMELLMTGFQADLGNISGEIQTLQEQSQLMNIKLKNRMDVQQKMNTILDGVVISPDLIRKISEGEVNEFFLQHLAELNQKIGFVKSQQGRHIKAFGDIGPELERLRLKAAEKARDFLAKKIESLKAPNTNIAIIQQNVLLKYKGLYEFLVERSTDAAAEIRLLYATTIGSHYLSLFDRYIRSLQKLQNVIADKSDLIASEENTKRGLPGLFGMKAQLKDKTNVFSFGDRVQVLTSSDPGIILPHFAEEQNLKFPFEAIFKSISRLLMDNACSEYLFALEFFVAPRQKHGRLPKEVSWGASVFNDIFDSTLKLLQAHSKQYIDASFDAVGILLCIRLNNQNIRIMQKRRVPCLESYTNATNMMLWPRFQAIMDMHVESLKKASPRALLPTKDIHPHYITRRYGEFAASILALNHGYDDALLTNSLQRLRMEVEHLLMRMSGEFTAKKSRLAFLINNYDLVVSLLSEQSMPSFDQERRHFNEILDSKINEYVEEELKPSFLTLTSFVRALEDESQLTSITQSADRFEAVATDFNNIWKPAISALNESIMQSFSNFQNGARVLHTALTQLLLSYKRFTTLWDRKFAAKKAQVQPVGLQSVMVEIKKFR
ncbi:Sac2 family-domain-containing protein [Gaertneriomyces semiglobifer]|nr:Sac2 family-domain-containing protein [Gaertneriomyces semiglobifer]